MCVYGMARRSVLLLSTMVTSCIVRVLLCLYCYMYVCVCERSNTHARTSQTVEVHACVAKYQ